MCRGLLAALGRIRGVELSAILMNEGILADEIRKLDIPIEIVDESRTDFFRAVGRAQGILGRFRPDILHTHRMKENILGFLSTRRGPRRISLICTQHGLDEPQSGVKWRFLSGVNRHVLSKRFRFVVVVSEDMRTALLKRYRFLSDKLVVIRNGTEVRDRHPVGRGNHRFVVGSAGRLFPVKDYPFFVEVAAEVRRHTGDVRFELAGEGPELGSISDRIRSCGVEDSFFLKGFVENMNDFYAGLDLYINTSRHEGFPMSVLEAMSHGLPVVAPTEGGIKEAVTDGSEGFLVEGRDPKRFAQRCLEIYRNPDLRRNLGEAARKKVEREFSTDAMAAKYHVLYRASLS